MTDSPLYIAFVWHMHQPYYKDPFTGIYRLPWVRLHGTKDYLDMVEIAGEFPDIRMNFNLVPSLLEQIVDYTEHGAKDVHLETTLKRASDLTEGDKVFILENFFLAHWGNMVKPFPRYHELLLKRGTRIFKGDSLRLINYFSESDFRDIQVLFNLCWIDPLFREKDDFLSYLVNKGRHFTEEDKKTLMEKQLGLLGRIIPAYRELSLKGSIELSFSPFYHPILPLLCNTDIARTAMPDVRLPGYRFSHPEDAEKQIAMGQDYFETVFGFKPEGMWPSEGSVSEEVLAVASRHGIRWVATDEGVLAHSLKKRLRDAQGNVTAPELLYTPYVHNNVSMIFRDHTISDLIGFVYSQWDPQKAAEDLIHRFHGIRKTLSGKKPRLVSVILDGENAWEHYKNDGNDFFRYLYEGLSREKGLKTTTVSDFIKTMGRGEHLEILHPGSWINSNFGIWIGHEEDNRSWEYLAETRETLEQFQRTHPEMQLEQAWKSVYIAEGSDWNWWYGDEHTTETQVEFDELFRFNLMKVYTEMGKDIPARLFVPVLRHDREISPTTVIRGFIKPTIDGLVSSYYEWYQGARLDVKKSGGSMHKSESLFSEIYFGFDKETLYLRIDPLNSFADFREGTTLSIITSNPSEIKIVCPVTGQSSSGELFVKKGDQWMKEKEIAAVAVGDIFEIGIPFADLKAKEKDEINLHISVKRDSEEIERCPWRGHISITVPTADFEAMMWH